MSNEIYGILLILCTILVSFVAVYIRKTAKKTQFADVFLLNFIFVIIWNLSMIAQIFLSDLLHIDPIYFDYIAYIGICFLPVSLLFTGILFTRTKIQFKWYYILLFIVPAISLTALWTNDYHHLFYVKYSTNLSEAVFGPFMTMHSVYSYLCIAIALCLLVSYIMKNSGFFSKQSLLIILGTLFPTVVNILGYIGVFNMSIYVTPITYIIALIFYSIALFKLQLLKSTPIALQRIVDRISDSYIVLDEDNNITDFNKTFLSTFKLKEANIRNVNIFDLLKSTNANLVNETILKDALIEVRNSSKTVTFEKKFPSYNKYFHIEINTITSNKNFLGTLLLLKDTTQHMQDMHTIKNNQDMLMEKERLASLGQLIGGISHNLKTPIMSISGAAEGLTDLINEYDASIGDPEVTVEDHHAIASDMKEWIEKIHSYTEYMSDIITAVKGQAVALSENENDEFTIDELVKRVNILMKHEIRNASLTLETNIEVPSTTTLHGDVNSLVQVVNNLITNAIQSYNGKKEESIALKVKKDNNDLIISVEDHGCGMPDDVQEKLFKSMITTKGKNGTGLGMFMSYSTIKGHFNGDITFTSEVGKGTTFNIIIPLLKS